MESRGHHSPNYLDVLTETRKQAQRPHLDRLAQLLERKHKVEIEIERLCENLERAHLVVAKQLNACIRNRVDALRFWICVSGCVEDAVWSVAKRTRSLATCALQVDVIWSDINGYFMLP